MAILFLYDNRQAGNVLRHLNVNTLQTVQ